MTKFSDIPGRGASVMSATHFPQGLGDPVDALHLPEIRSPQKDNLAETPWVNVIPSGLLIHSLPVGFHTDLFPERDVLTLTSRSDC